MLKRYGIPQHPRYALLSFFEGNDSGDIRAYVQWQRGKDYWHFNLSSKNFFQRYGLTVQDVFTMGIRAAQAFRRESLNAEKVHPDLVVLRLDDQTIKTVFFYKNDTRSADELLREQEWNILKRLLTEFKTVSRENGIMPLVMFIPTKAHIYAEYSTRSSGIKWREIRDQQIAAKRNVETAMSRLCEAVGIRLISLTPVFERAAKRGQFLYYPFDTHWNSEARQIAAWFVGRNVLGVRNRAAAAFEASVQQ